MFEKIKSEKNNPSKLSPTIVKKIILSTLLILLITFSFSFYFHSWMRVDSFLVVGFFIALALGAGRIFLIDWLPFYLLFTIYQSLRGFVPLVIDKVNIYPMINADRALFGNIPTIYLQTQYFSPTNIQWYDVLAVIIYFSHFISPLIIAFSLWLINRKRYYLFIISLLTLSFAAFITYFLYPAMPPWLASDERHIPNVYKIMTYVFNAVGQGSFLPDLYGMLLPNPVAAMPSLHAAYPLLCFFWLVSCFRYKALLFLPYVLAVWLIIVYLGEHYVIDIIIGALYAAGAFLFALALPHLSKLILREKNHFIR